MNEVISADGKEIAVAAEYSHRQVGTGQGQSGGKRNGPPVRSVVSVHIQIAGHPACTTDAGNNNRSVKGNTGHLQTIDIGVQDHTQSAARAPYMRDSARFQILVIGMKAMLLIDEANYSFLIKRDDSRRRRSAVGRWCYGAAAD